MNQTTELLYTISVLRKQIDSIDNILKDGHILVDGIEKLEKKRKSLQVCIYALTDLLEEDGIEHSCMGCGTKESDPECDCEWATCNCGYPFCWIRKNGTYRCNNCKHDTDKRAYD